MPRHQCEVCAGKSSHAARLQGGTPRAAATKQTKGDPSGRVVTLGSSGGRNPIFGRAEDKQASGTTGYHQGMREPQGSEFLSWTDSVGHFKQGSCFAKTH